MVPAFSLQAKVTMDDAIALRAEQKRIAAAGMAPSLNDMVIAASARALRDHPLANGSYADGRFEHHGRVNVGVAVAAPGTLVVPTVFDADQKTLSEIASDTRELVRLVKEKKIRPDQLGGGTFTVSNLGMFGVESFVPIVNTPQAAILGVGEVVGEPAVEAGALVERRVVRMTLACDHRILYGADAARFLGRVRELLESPHELLDPLE